MFDEYWPWWLGVIALSTVAIGHWLTVGRPFAVSGLWSRMLRWRSERTAERHDAALGDSAAFEAALLRATLEEFQLDENSPDQSEPDQSDMDSADHPVGEVAGAYGDGDGQGEDHHLLREVPRRPVLWRNHLPISAGLVFLLSLVAGGFLAALSTGTFSVRFDMGAQFHDIFGDGPGALLALLAGGVLVGFGTSMSGGCTSGHGLNGCANRQTGSLVATATFFGTGVLVSLLLGGLL